MAADMQNYKNDLISGGVVWTTRMSNSRHQSTKAISEFQFRAKRADGTHQKVQTCKLLDNLLKNPKYWPSKTKPVVKMMQNNCWELCKQPRGM